VTNEEVRPARPTDVAAIKALMDRFATQGLLLPRSEDELTAKIRDFGVLEKASGLVGVVALHPVSVDLAEIRSLAVDSQWQGQGFGKQLVQSCLADARRLGIRRIFALTYQVPFFAKLGFEQVDKKTLPQKIWNDCMHCPRFSDCDEIAVHRLLFLE